MARACNVSLTLLEGMYDSLKARAGKAGWTVQKEIRHIIQPYVEKPHSFEKEDKMHQCLLIRARVHKAERKAWRLDTETAEPLPHPSCYLNMGFPLALMLALEKKAVQRRSGTVAGEVYIALHAAMNQEIQ